MKPARQIKSEVVMGLSDEHRGLLRDAFKPGSGLKNAIVSASTKILKDRIRTDRVVIRRIFIDDVGGYLFNQYVGGYLFNQSVGKARSPDISSVCDVFDAKFDSWPNFMCTNNSDEDFPLLDEKEWFEKLRSLDSPVLADLDEHRFATPRADILSLIPLFY